MKSRLAPSRPTAVGACVIKLDRPEPSRQMRRAGSSLDGPTTNLRYYMRINHSHYELCCVYRNFKFVRVVAQSDKAFRFHDVVQIAKGDAPREMGYVRPYQSKKKPSSKSARTTTVTLRCMWPDTHLPGFTMWWADKNDELAVVDCPSGRRRRTACAGSCARSDSCGRRER
ncbi:hypothetical protein EVAR_14377_1 [Eumeta japonica]|uniref:Uncharacterized protein n=1 Tax=Eumeta variegata TaxID=151549 RepID=A0A4C1TX66_EUMVA|nr:hypothetical protein EVAR_14377_1 [Eumeta japonica]